MHSQSRRTRDLLAGDIVAHRALPVPTDQPDQQSTAPRVEQVGAVYDRAAADRAWATRRADLRRLAGVGDVLTGIDQRIADLQDRVNALLDGAHDEPRGRSESDRCGRPNLRSTTPG